MRFPEHRIMMEAALPSSVHTWFGHELELRGIDSVIYTRYIISLLQQDVEEIDISENDTDIWENAFQKACCRKSGRKDSDFDTDKRKKKAVVDYLFSLCDEAYEIESLVEELYCKLKEMEILTVGSPKACCDVQETVANEDLVCTQIQDPTERYYAAFPALHNHDHLMQDSPLLDESIWKNNPITGHTEHEQNLCTPEEKQHGCKAEVKEKKVKETKDPFYYNYPKNKKRRTSRFKVKPYIGSIQVNEFANTPQFPGLTTQFGNNIKCTAEPVDLMDTENERLCSMVENMLKEILLPDSKADRLLEKSQQTFEEEESEKHDNNDNNDTWPDCTLPELSSAESSNTKHNCLQLPSCLLNQDSDSGYVMSTLSSPVHGLINSDDDEALGYLAALDESCFLPASLNKELALSDSSNQSFDAGFHEDSESLSNLSITDENFSVQTLPLIQHNSSQPSSRGSSVQSDSTASTFVSTVSSKVDNTKQETDFHDPVDANVISANACLIPRASSLVDWDYLSQFVLDMQSLSDSPDLTYSRSENDVVNAILAGIGYNSPCWQDGIFLDASVLPGTYSNIKYPYGTEHMLQQNDLSQLWDIKRSIHNQLPLEYINDDVDESCDSTVLDGNAVKFSLCYEDVNNKIKDDAELCPINNSSYLLPQICLESIPNFDGKDTVFEEGGRKREEYLEASKALPWEGTLASDRSNSFGDMQSLWDNFSQDNDIYNPILSRSFELVPSDNSAFNDVVPKNLHHVRSEPNLTSFGLSVPIFETTVHDLYDESVSDDPDNNIGAAKDSPNEHLYFSPKTHFRPIKTPLNSPESDVLSYEQEDVFGGHKSSRSPYQSYNCDYEDEEDSFIPKFKIQNDLNKCSQTGLSPSNERYFKSCKGSKVLQIPSTVNENDETETIDIGMLLIEKVHTGVDCSLVSDGRSCPNTPDVTVPSSFKKRQICEESANICLEDNKPEEMYEDEAPTICVALCKEKSPVTCASDTSNNWPISSLWGTEIDKNDSKDVSCWSYRYMNVWSNELTYCNLNPPYWVRDELSGTNREDLGKISSEEKTDIAPDNVKTNEEKDYITIKLVFRKGRKLQGSLPKENLQHAEMGFMPMPDDAIYLSDLENHLLQAEACQYSQEDLQRKNYTWNLNKPCSFFLEGNCHRSDCRFAHDVSNITCRFWEDGDCFKDAMCPFLHGYPRNCDSSCKNEIHDAELSNNIKSSQTDGPTVKQGKSRNTKSKVAKKYRRDSAKTEDRSSEET